MELIIHGIIAINCSYPSIIVIYVYFLKSNNICFYKFINLLLKTKLGFMLNNIPWHIAYAMVLGLEPKEFDEHSPKV